MTVWLSRGIPTGGVALLIFLAVGFLPAGYAGVLSSGNPGNSESPESRSGSTSVGEVDFDHEMHFSDLEIPCEECHHETNARALDTPHPQYLTSSSIDCFGCHGETVGVSPAQHCAECHTETPGHIANEAFSCKVVIHQVCWRCHGVGRGEEASRSCGSCHRPD